VDASLQAGEPAARAEPDAAGFRTILVTAGDDTDRGEALLRALPAAGFRVRALHRRQPTLEDVFLAATRRSWDAVDRPKTRAATPAGPASP
jgi:ABC-2 type transport system ATP-binding protein